MSTTPDLDALLRDPLSVEGDDIMAAFEKASGGDPADQTPVDGTPAANTSTQADTTTGAPAGAREAVTQPSQPQAGQGEADEPSGVLAKDGKHVLPFGVLQEARERAIRAEVAAQELSEKLASLQQQAATGEVGQVRETGEIISKEQLAELREESPQLAAMFDGLLTKIADQEGRITASAKPVEDFQREQQVQRQAAAEETVASAIAAVPKLAHVRAHDAETFNGIAAMDKVLIGQPQWAGKPMSQRFEAAVRMYEAAYAPIVLPGTAPAATTSAPAPAPAPAVDAAARVQQAIANAHKAAPAPSTLSDIPGGHLPPQNDLEIADQMTSAALTNQLMSMTPEQQSDFLSKFA